MEERKKARSAGRRTFPSRRTIQRRRQQSLHRVNRFPSCLLNRLVFLSKWMRIKTSVESLSSERHSRLSDNHQNQRLPVFTLLRRSMALMAIPGRLSQLHYYCYSERESRQESIHLCTP